MNSCILSGISKLAFQNVRLRTDQIQRLILPAHPDLLINRPSVRRTKLRYKDFCDSHVSKHREREELVRGQATWRMTLL